MRSSKTFFFTLAFKSYMMSHRHFLSFFYSIYIFMLILSCQLYNLICRCQAVYQLAVEGDSSVSITTRSCFISRQKLRNLKSILCVAHRIPVVGSYMCFVCNITPHCTVLHCTALEYAVLILCNVRMQDGLSVGLSHDGGVGMFQSGSAPYRYLHSALIPYPLYMHPFLTTIP